MLKLEVGRGEILTQRILDYVVALIGAQSVQEARAAARGILQLDALRYTYRCHDAVLGRLFSSSHTKCGLQKVWIYGAIYKSEFETTGPARGPCVSCYCPSRSWC